MFRFQNWNSKKKSAFENFGIPNGNQVFVNLLENASKYGRPDGWVTVNGRAVDGHVELCLSDGGSGIPVETRESVFECFYHVDKGPLARRRRHWAGTRHREAIVQSHGGKVWVESERGTALSFISCCRCSLLTQLRRLTN
ncbi:MAG: ATP-binding protein [Verrucomicrobiota bacterium]